MHTVRIILSGLLLVGQLFADDDSIALLIKTAKDSENPALRTVLLKGMIKGLEGHVNVNAPEGWKELNAELVKAQILNIRNWLVKSDKSSEMLVPLKKP